MNRNIYRPSPEFLDGLENCPEPKYKVALRAGVRPQTFYALCSGIIPCRQGDERIISAGRIIGIEEKDCLEKI